MLYFLSALRSVRWRNLHRVILWFAQILQDSRYKIERHQIKIENIVIMFQIKHYQSEFLNNTYTKYTSCISSSLNGKIKTSKHLCTNIFVGTFFFCPMKWNQISRTSCQDNKFSLVKMYEAVEWNRYNDITS